MTIPLVYDNISIPTVYHEAIARVLRIPQIRFYDCSGNWSGEKRDIVENEYHIPYNEDIERSVEEMCNASQGVLNKGIEIGVIKGKVEAYHEIGMSTSEIAAKMNISEKEVNDIINSFVK